MSIAVHDGKVT